LKLSLDCLPGGGAVAAVGDLFCRSLIDLLILLNYQVVIARIATSLPQFRGSSVDPTEDRLEDMIRSCLQSNAVVLNEEFPNKKLKVADLGENRISLQGVVRFITDNEVPRKKPFLFRLIAPPNKAETFLSAR